MEEKKVLKGSGPHRPPHSSHVVNQPRFDARWVERCPPAPPPGNVRDGDRLYRSLVKCWTLIG